MSESKGITTKIDPAFMRDFEKASGLSEFPMTLLSTVEIAPERARIIAESPKPLITRIEAVVDAAIASGATQEVALMSWLHQHLTAAHSLLAGAETFHVSEAGKAVLAEIKALK